MSGIAWDDLMRFGLCDLRLSPEIFWSLTPAELMLMAGGNHGGDMINRDGLEKLMAQFPDRAKET